MIKYFFRLNSKVNARHKENSVFTIVDLCQAFRHIFRNFVICHIIITFFVRSNISCSTMNSFIVILIFYNFKYCQFSFIKIFITTLGIFTIFFLCLYIYTNTILRFENKYKAINLGKLGIEPIQIKDTGNYDKCRTCFNYSYILIIKFTIQEQIYSKLKDNKIYYNDGSNTNLLNDAIITSGKDFFQSLGMKLKESSKIHQVEKFFLTKVIFF